MASSSTAASEEENSRLRSSNESVPPIRTEPEEMTFFSYSNW